MKKQTDILSQKEAVGSTNHKIYNERIWLKNIQNSYKEDPSWRKFTVQNFCWKAGE